MKPTYEELEQQLAESHRALCAETTAHENTQMQLEKMAAENAGLKAKGLEVLKEAEYVYSHYNRMVDHLDGESVDSQTLREFQEAIEMKTPATDAFLAEVRAQGVEMLREHPAIKLCSLTHVCDELAAQLRKGVQS